MFLPSISTLAFGLVLTYITYSVWSVIEIFVTPQCVSQDKCVTSFIKNKPSLNLHLFTSHVNHVPRTDVEVNKVAAFKDFNYWTPSSKDYTLDIPQRTLNNGSLYLIVILAQEKSFRENAKYTALLENQHLIFNRFTLTQFQVPDQFIFNLLEDEGKNQKAVHKFPQTHIKSRVTINLLTDPLEIPYDKIPGEMTHKFRFGKGQFFYPILNYNILETRLEHLKLLDSTPQTVTIKFEPISLGKLRFVIHIEAAMKTMKGLGFNHKDLDDVKNMFAGTNLYLLCGTIIIVSIHLLFDFLAFKNDISFWKSRSNMVGLSSRTVFWRAFSQSIIFFYLLDEKASLIVSVPSGIGLIIELWKVKKVIRRQKTDEEKDTDAYDAESMRYLSYVLYPLCICGAIYSLLYQPHKSWYSWTLQSLVNGVYAFGFLFMLPQLFVNYRLKSVAALPWRAFTYKAFNTFIDDIFAFLIVMPTSHRVACFRDDIVFLVYLYQRWLYPVDKTRIDESAVALGETKSISDKKDN